MTFVLGNPPGLTEPHEIAEFILDGYIHDLELEPPDYILPLLADRSLELGEFCGQGLLGRSDVESKLVRVLDKQGVLDPCILEVMRRCLDTGCFVGEVMLEDGVDYW